jgi:hypothetical protein
MLRVVLPVAASRATWLACAADATRLARAADTAGATDTADAAGAADTSGTAGATRPVVDVVPIEIVVHIDVDVVAAAPAAAAARAAPDRRAHHHAEAERHERGAGWVGRVVNRWIRINGRAIDDRRTVGRHVDHFGVRRLHDDDRLLLDDLRLDLLLLVGFEGALVLGFLPHPLNGVHDVALLCEEGVAEIGRPLNVIRKPLDHFGNRRHRLDRRVPGLLRHRIGQRLVFQILVLRHPLLQLDDLERVGGSNERLSQQRVRVERDRRDERIELIRGEFHSFRFGGGSRRR